MLALGTGQVLASQAALAAAGLGALPILGRELGPGAYGEFSLYVTLLGVVTYQDVARQLLIHEQSHGTSRREDLDALARFTTVLLVGLALLVGPFLLHPIAAAALALVTLLHGLGSRNYARIAVAGRAGTVTALRNFAWAGAFVGVAALSLVHAGPLTWALPFVAAALIVWLSYHWLASKLPRENAPQPSTGPLWGRLTGWSTLRASPELERYRSAVIDLLGFTLASSAIVSIDRVLLKRTTTAEELGMYCGAYDIATRVHVVSSAIAAMLYPTLATQIAMHGRLHAARRFVQLASLVVCAYFIGLLGLLAFDDVLLGQLLGPAFVASRPLFVLMLVGVFVHTFGFLITPWQRAQGDFATTRRAYQRAAVVMLAVGVITIPLHGALGALIAYLCSRVAELQLIVVEAKRLPSELAIPRRLAIAAAMLAILAMLCLVRFGELA
jgi:O-antigen/teichoic acid export membrane protein